MEQPVLTGSQAAAAVLPEECFSAQLPFRGTTAVRVPDARASHPSVVGKALVGLESRADPCFGRPGQNL